MLHARKMRLVPYYEKEGAKGNDFPILSKAEPDRRFDDHERDKYFRIIDSKTVQTPGTPLTRLYREIYHVLHANALNDPDKWQVYRQILQKYLHKLPPPSSGKKKIEPKRYEDKNVKPISEDKILESVPKKFQIKEKKLMDFTRNVENVEWDHKGSVNFRSIFVCYASSQHTAWVCW